VNAQRSNPAASVVIFTREKELAEIRCRLGAHQPFLLYGPAGVGKTLLLRSVLCDFPDVLYCAETKSPQAMFRAVAEALVAKHDLALLRSLGRAGLSSKTSVALKGLVVDSLRATPRMIILDQLRQPSQALAAAVRELIGAGCIVVSAARSAHMEDAG
jgi:AAA ATPase domain